MAQDTSSITQSLQGQASPASQTDSSTPSNTHTSSDPAVVPQVPVSVVSPADMAQTGTVVADHEVTLEGDVQAVPQETVGLGDTAAPTVTPPVETPAVSVEETVDQSQTDVEPETVAEASSQVPVEAPAPTQEPEEDIKPLTTDAGDVTVDSTETPAEANTENSEAEDGEKSPLDVLEEILAGAESEKKQAEEEEKKQAEEEARKEAELAAKEEAYKQQAQERLAATSEAVEAAKQTREEVDQNLAEQGKIELPSDGDTGKKFEIRQLEHQKPE